MVSAKETIAVVAKLYDLYHNADDDRHVQTPLPLLLPSIPKDDVPSAVHLLLEPRDLRFQELPQVLQHALLWSVGHATTRTGDVMAIRTQCGLSLAESLAFSTFSLPTCAVSTPLGGTATDSLVWLLFTDQSPLPELVTTSPSSNSQLHTATWTPCATSSAVYESFCDPTETEPLVSLWLDEISQANANRKNDNNDMRADRQSQAGDEVDDAPIATVPITTPAQSPILDRTLADVATSGTSANISFLLSHGTGLTSDFASVYYAFRASGGSLPRLELQAPVPLDVQERVDAVHLKFQSLTGTLQRALLWDSGFVLVQHAGSDIAVDVVPVYVKCGLRMRDVAPDRGYFETISGCAVQDCSTGNTTGTTTTSSDDDRIYSYRAAACARVEDLSVLSRCAIPSAAVASLDVPVVASSSAIWAVGNISASDRAGIPNMWLQRHATLAASSSASRVGVAPPGNQYAIHSASTEVHTGVCPRTPSFIIPCVTVDQPSLQHEWCRPLQSELVATWLQQEQHQEMALATLILLAGAILMALALDLFADRKPRFFGNGRVSASMPSITSTVLDGIGEQSQTFHSDRTGWSSVRSARSVRSNR